MAFVSCSRPYMQENFVKTSERDEYGRYEFVLDMADSSSYSISFLIIMDCNRKQFNLFDNASVNVMWGSPSGRFYEEKVWFSRDDLSQETMLSRVFLLPYRAKLRPFEYGKWSVYLTLDEKIIKDYRIPGIGIKLKTEN